MCLFRMSRSIQFKLNKPIATHVRTLRVSLKHNVVRYNFTLAKKNHIVITTEKNMYNSTQLFQIAAQRMGLPTECAESLTSLPSVCIGFILSKILGYSIIVGSSIIKVPQIINILKSRKVEGLNIYMFMLELIGYVCWIHLEICSLLIHTLIVPSESVCIYEYLDIRLACSTVTN